MVPISNTGSVPKTVTWYWHFVCAEPNFSTWRDILQKSAFTSWYLTVRPYKLKLNVSKNWQLFSNFNTHQFWSQKQLKTNWAQFFEHKERPQCANIWQSLIKHQVQEMVTSLPIWNRTDCRPLFTQVTNLCTGLQSPQDRGTAGPRKKKSDPAENVQNQKIKINIIYTKKVQI